MYRGSKRFQESALFVYSVLCCALVDGILDIALDGMEQDELSIRVLHNA